jgi:hypothetical protein
MGIYDQLSQLDKVTPPPQPVIAEVPAKLKPVKLETKKKMVPGDMQERLQESKKERLQESKKVFIFACIQPYLDLKASNTVSFRYPDTLLEWLEETLYALKKEHGKKLTKNSILVAALAFTLWDLKQNDQASFLYQQFIQDGD